MNRVFFVTYADDRAGRKEGKYVRTQKFISEFLTHNRDFGITNQLHFNFDHYSRSDVFLRNAHWQSDPVPDNNGRCYKPWAIKQALDSANMGDFIIYNDCSEEHWRHLCTLPQKSGINSPPSRINPNTHSIVVLKEMCCRNKGILTTYVSVPPYNGINHDPMSNSHDHEHYTLDSCMDAMNMRKYAKSFQHASGLIVLQKNNESIQFVNEWLHYNQVPACATLEAWGEEHHKKMGHRTDQSISGLLINNINNDLVIQHDFDAIRPYNFLSLCAMRHPYSFISSNYKISL